jgi:hypothetical protein
VEREGEEAVKSDVPAAFSGFDLHRWRRQGHGWPAKPIEPTAQECADSCWANMQTAAAELAQAKRIYDGLELGHRDIPFTLGEMSRLRAEQAHWRGLMEWHRKRVVVADPRLPREREPGED